MKEKAKLKNELLTNEKINYNIFTLFLKINDVKLNSLSWTLVSVSKAKCCIFMNEQNQL